jgi:aquaporin NIP
MNDNLKKFAAEFFGTFALVFAGTGAIVIDHATHGAVSHVGIAFTFGLVILAMIYTMGDISGAHFNPAVTLGFFAARRLEQRMVAPYILSQCVGGLFASFILRLIFPAEPDLGATQPAGPALQSFVLELVMTWLLMLVILSVSKGAKEKGITAGIAIGSVIALEALFGGPISGASMNPARSLAPALVGLNFNGLWIYLGAPVLGALLAVPVCCLVREKGCCCASAEPFCR